MLRANADWAKPSLQTSCCQSARGNAGNSRTTCLSNAAKISGLELFGQGSQHRDRPKMHWTIAKGGRTNLSSWMVSLELDNYPIERVRSEAI